MKGVGSEKKLNSATQLCAGYKLIDKKLKQYEYSGEGKETKFKETKKKISFVGRIKRKVLLASGSNYADIIFRE